MRGLSFFVGFVGYVKSSCLQRIWTHAIIYIMTYKPGFAEVSFMLFWWFILMCDLLLPITLLIAGKMMWKHCPKQINGVLGYRTARSMKNMDTWRFAHEYCGRLWWKIGLFMIVPSALIHIPFYRSDNKTIGIVSLVLVTIQIVIVIASIFPTEAALKKTFHSDGTRK